MRWLRAFGAFWYDFIVGDDWRIAASVVGVLAVGAVAVVAGADGEWLAALLGVALVVVFVAPMLGERREHR
ncbi:MAG: hypothetical protein U0667_17000 [Chloroflexota bacterium]